ncbi:MAG: hemerythrin domain-containing protein, partial [Burkholderiaceae bacterium]|nr:hemerythrin domain-containing protein [Burkholderiaceae bacterium]
MALLNWDDRLLVGVEPMDQTHREFVELLGELARAAEADTISALDRLIEHTVLHFRQEEEWMVDSGWGPPCHAGEHHQVLEIIRTVRTRALAGEWKLVGVLVN